MRLKYLLGSLLLTFLVVCFVLTANVRQSQTPSPQTVAAFISGSGIRHEIRLPSPLERLYAKAMRYLGLYPELRLNPAIMITEEDEVAYGAGSDLR